MLCAHDPHGSKKRRKKKCHHHLRRKKRSKRPKEKAPRGIRRKFLNWKTNWLKRQKEEGKEARRNETNSLIIESIKLSKVLQTLSN